MSKVFCEAYYCYFNKRTDTKKRICSKSYLHIGKKEENCKDFIPRNQK